MAVHGGSLLSGLLAYADASWMPDISANNFFWIELLRRAGEDGIDVLLDGEGGDELFMVPRYLLADLLGRGRLRRARNLLQHWPQIAGNPSTRARLSIARRYGLGGLVPHSVERAWWVARGNESAIKLTRPAERAARRASDPAPWKRLDGPLWWRNLAYHMTDGPDRFGAPEHALRIARMAGVRRRRPLLDLDLSEYVLQLPPDMAFSPWFTKNHARRAMVDRVPDSIILRRKKTLFSDVRSRAIEPDLAFGRELLGPGAEVRRYVEPETIEAAVTGLPADADEMTRLSWGFKLQHLAGTEMWLRVQADPAAGEALREQGRFTELRYDLVRQEP
jgi:asparagine synthetase B (glutamine-hydrolysing)